MFKSTVNWAEVEAKYDGQTSRGQDIGKQLGQRYIWHACEGCGKRRWVQIKRQRPDTLRCYKCARAISRLKYAGKYARARFRNTNGYIMVRITPENPCFSMVERVGLSEGISGYAMEHRLIMAHKIGRPLTQKEVVHHINGIKDDNRLVNLLLMVGGKHNILIPTMQKRIQALEARLRGQSQLL